MTRDPDQEPQPPRRRVRKATPSEVELWRQVMRDVVPLHRAAAQIPESDYRPPASEAIGFERLERRPAPPPPLDRLPEIEVGRPAGLDKRNATRLRRGKLPIEGRIDLHGMTQARAHSVLLGFVARAYELGQRCVLVITGKGTRPDGEVGVLRSAVPRWLNEAPLRDRVLAVTHAIPPDGGEGAFYVLLRRKRGKGR
jgi:DNA-nicking Smr family endonuclease